MTDAQTWTLIVGMLAVLASVVTFSSTMTLRVMRAEFQTVHVRIDHVDQRLGDRIDGVETRLGDRIDSVEQRLGDRIDSVETRLRDRIDLVETRLGDKVDHLDRDVQAVVNRLMDG